MTLDEVLQDACRRLATGATDRASAFRTLGLATVAADGTPDLRLLVLRAFDAADRRLSLHTDARSAKFGQMLAQPAVALMGWDRVERLQIRLYGRASLHSGDTLARAAWAALPAVTRQLYRLRQPPGATLPDPSPDQYREAPEAAGFAAFVVVEVALDRLETLHLTEHGQMRASFGLGPDGISATWLVP